VLDLTVQEYAGAHGVEPAKDLEQLCLVCVEPERQPVADARLVDRQESSVG
jgi:hypothetical protein